MLWWVNTRRRCWSRCPPGGDFRSTAWYRRGGRDRRISVREIAHRAGRHRRGIPRRRTGSTPLRRRGPGRCAGGVPRSGHRYPSRRARCGGHARPNAVPCCRVVGCDMAALRPRAGVRSRTERCAVTHRAKSTAASKRASGSGACIQRWSAPGTCVNSTGTPAARSASTSWRLCAAGTKRSASPWARRGRIVVGLVRAARVVQAASAAPGEI